MADQQAQPTKQTTGPVYPSQMQQTPPSQGTNGLALAALITGILGTGLIALILGILGLKHANKNNGNGKGMAIAGIILGALGMIVAIVITIIWIVSISALMNQGVMTTP